MPFHKFKGADEKKCIQNGTIGPMNSNLVHYMTGRLICNENIKCPMKHTNLYNNITNKPKETSIFTFLKSIMK